jgi:hypothetical protein
MSTVLANDLQPLPNEPWGRRMLRARKDVARLTSKQAAAIVSRVLPTDNATICRIERTSSLPRDRNRRLRAQILCLAYGVDPSYLGFQRSDLPDGWTYETVIEMLAAETPPTTGDSWTSESSPFAPVYALDRRRTHKHLGRVA